MNWQPIESAPKDATEVLLWGKKRCADGYWLQAAYAGNGAWIWPYLFHDPTHWMPLPPIPDEEQKAKANSWEQALCGKYRIRRWDVTYDLKATETDDTAEFIDNLFAKKP
jgi:hypothetical protein